MPNKKQQQSELRLEEITAYDHYATPGWSYPKDHEKPLIITSIGWLIGESKEYLYLATLRSDEGGVGNVGAVLKSTIIKRRRIR